ncbi:DUF1853 family protein [Autumnicola musiva]|uniref:DUF1853 family protein n=1 Tax=Autumnicola musiva TaxID=3075589 RepID=A0ABU3D957_9FLAO|nr:DUF1853 family protein [Zunongwangia sp. F117]MDT0678071.1 DUF1853 family protein [Zunongwangia sp. F117]
MGEYIQQQFKGFLSTPPLWKKDELFGIKQFKLPEGYLLPEALQNLYSPHSILGKRMESFFEHFINQTRDYDLLASNIQINREKLTIGEIDFLLKQLSNKKLLHVELVYKFYVYDPSFKEELQRWIGPNRKDSLLQKIEKLRKKQFPLLFKNETKDFLQSIPLDPNYVEQEACFRANLFLPKKWSRQSISLVNKECICGYWISNEDFQAEEYKHALFYSPKKQNWPLNPRYNNIWFSFSEIRTQINFFLKKKRAPLIWMKKNKEEYERFFVVWW